MRTNVASIRTVSAGLYAAGVMIEVCLGKVKLYGLEMPLHFILFFFDFMNFISNGLCNSATLRSVHGLLPRRCAWFRVTLAAAPEACNRHSHFCENCISWILSNAETSPF